MPICSQMSNLRYARKNINHVCPFRIEKSDPRARCVAGNSASLVTGQRRCPRVGFFYPERKHMTDIIILAHRIGISGEFSRAGKLYLAPSMLDESRAVTQYFVISFIIHLMLT